jgi:nicotinate-nucleotide adenylyltransferase
VAEEITEAEHLGELRFVPAAIPPHKRDRAITAGAHRLRMIELAIADAPRFRAWPIELTRTGPSFTVDTVRALRAEVGPDERVVLAMGRDQFAEFHTWREPDAILGLCDLVVVSRPPDAGSLDLRRFPVVSSGPLCYDSASDRFVHPSGHTVRSLLVTPLDISSTALRRSVGHGDSVRFLVTPAVEDYIRTHELYREDASH